MTKHNDEIRPNAQVAVQSFLFVIPISLFLRALSFVIRHLNL
jgi:hypothetical protein